MKISHFFRILFSRRMNRQVIGAISKAAEREGGFDKITFVGRKSRWHECCGNGLLYYNVISSGSTKVIKL